MKITYEYNSINPRVSFYLSGGGVVTFWGTLPQTATMVLAFRRKSDVEPYVAILIPRGEATQVVKFAKATGRIKEIAVFRKGDKKHVQENTPMVTTRARS